jgi:hypothetical protein
MFDHAAYKRKRRADPQLRRADLDKDNASKRARRKANPQKAREQDKLVYRKHADRWKTRHLQRSYGLTNEQWNNRFIEQGRCCAICKNPNPGRMGWHTDHNHETEKVRGILCGGCNLSIGLVHEDVTRLRSMIQYLEQDRVGH